MLQDEELTEKIIGAAINVHKELGPGYIESIYEEALCIELNHLRIPYERQKPVKVHYRGTQVGDHRLDLLVYEKFVVELKAISDLRNIHFSIVRSYLKALNLESGLLINFADIPLTVKRVGREIY